MAQRYNRKRGILCEKIPKGQIYLSRTDNEATDEEKNRILRNFSLQIDLYDS